MPRAAGTRTFLDVLRAGFRAPKPESSAADQEALERGEARSVSCFLRGSAPPYPKRPKQGTLELVNGAVRWRAFSVFSRQSFAIDVPVRSLNVRDVGPVEWNIKRGGKAFGVIPVPEFKVLVAETDRGVLELSVPSTDVPLVVSALG